MTAPEGPLGQRARDHLWPHFTKLSALSEYRVPIIERGDGCYLTDITGKRYLDGLAGLFAVQIGYSYGREVAAAATAQLEQLPYYTNWGFAHPRAIELAAEVAALAPERLNRVFFVNSGSEAIEAAWKLARDFFALHGERRWKVVARRTAYHGTTLGALSLTGIPVLKNRFEPLVPEVIHVRNTDTYRVDPGASGTAYTALLLDELERAIVASGPETVAMIVMEPVQAAGGAFTPPEGYFDGVRAICDRYGILLCADEVICGFGRLGSWFGSERYGLRPDLITCAKGLSSAYAPIGAVIAADRVAAPFMDEDAMYMHGATFGGHPVVCAIALKNLEIMKRERLVAHVGDTQQAFHSRLEELLALPIVGDLRGSGFFYALELVKDKDTKTSFDREERETLLLRFLTPELLTRGLICRADARGNPVIQLSPPLIAEQEQFDEIVGILGDVLSEGWAKFRAGVLN